MVTGSIGVVGLGTMGAGIAQAAIEAGIPTVAWDVSEEFVQRGRDSIARQLGRKVEKGKLSDNDRAATLALLDTYTEIEALARCELVIEAIIEDISVKQTVFRQLEATVPTGTILATNTSALSVTEIASALESPERVVGMHFFNPAAVLPLVEIVRGERSSDDSVETARNLAERMQKQPIVCADTPGFVVNRMLIPVLNEAVRVLDEGIAQAEDIDLGMRTGTNWPIGPLALLDLIGIDTYVYVCNALWDAYHESRFSPPPRVVRMMKAGLLGRKSGRGFYTYDEAN